MTTENNEVDMSLLSVDMMNMLPKPEQIPLAIANMQLRMSALEAENAELKGTIKTLCKMVGAE